MSNTATTPPTLAAIRELRDHLTDPRMTRIADDILSLQTQLNGDHARGGDTECAMSLGGLRAVATDIAFLLAEVERLRGDAANWRDLCQSADDHGWMFDGGCSIKINVDSIASGARITKAMTDTTSGAQKDA